MIVSLYAPTNITTNLFTIDINEHEEGSHTNLDINLKSSDKVIEHQISQFEINEALNNLDPVKRVGPSKQKERKKKGKAPLIVLLFELMN